MKSLAQPVDHLAILPSGRPTRTWPKNKHRNLLAIDPLIGPVNKNAVRS